jgi:peptidoglycan/LPS O-acetylase OafA/YrhL
MKFVKEKGRIPSLDGLRAVAILLVCLHHLAEQENSPLRRLQNLGLGPLGVRIFFVISGMLITRLLLREREKTGAISLHRFYIRRALRIFPAMWFYVAVIALLSAAGIVLLHGSDFLYALTYSANYSTHLSWFLGHIWSLSVEEQFYLLWPLILCFVRPQAGTRAALLAIVFAPLFRLSILLLFPKWPYLYWFPTTCDAIATGCLLSLLPSGRWRQMIARSIASRWFIAAPFAVLLVNAARYRIEWVFIANGKGHLFILLDTVGVTFINCAIALIVERVITVPHDFFGQVLNLPMTVWLGKISYSLYLWQELFIIPRAPNWITRFPANFVAALCAASFSYYLIELPVLQLRKRLALGEVTTGKFVPSSHI